MPDRKRTVAAKASLALSRRGLKADPGRRMRSMAMPRVRTEGSRPSASVSSGSTHPGPRQDAFAVAPHPRCGAGQVAVREGAHDRECVEQLTPYEPPPTSLTPPTPRNSARCRSGKSIAYRCRVRCTPIDACCGHAHSSEEAGRPPMCRGACCRGQRGLDCQGCSSPADHQLPDMRSRAPVPRRRSSPSRYHASPRRLRQQQRRTGRLSAAAGEIATEPHRGQGSDHGVTTRWSTPRTTVSSQKPNGSVRRTAQRPDRVAATTSSAPCTRRRAHRVVRPGRG